MARKSATGKGAGKSRGKSSGSAADTISTPLKRTSAELTADPNPDSPRPADAPETPEEQRAPRTINFGSRSYAAEKSDIDGHTLDILPDMPDIRDRAYTPRLSALRQGIFPRIAFPVRNQKLDSSCTGFSTSSFVVNAMKPAASIGLVSASTTTVWFSRRALSGPSSVEGPMST